jgi:23S rRNA (uridine2552-2'-O)-methyltransferase
MLGRLGRKVKFVRRIAMIPVPVLFFTNKNYSTQSIKENTDDPYTKITKGNEFRSRAAFKLIEIDDRYRIIRKAETILDLGCAPGGWTQVLCQRTIKPASILGIDRDPVKQLSDVRQSVMVKFLQADVKEHETHVKIFGHFKTKKIDLIVSDLSPSIVGESEYDSNAIIMLNRSCIEISETMLKRGGTLLMKTLRGPFEMANFEFCKFHFKTVTRIKPSASRTRSPELYFLCQGFKETSFWALVDQKGGKITLEEFQKCLPSKFNMNDKEMEKFDLLIASMFKDGVLKEANLKYDFEKEILERSKTKIPMVEQAEEDLDKMSPREIFSNIDDMYNAAVEQKIVKSMPSSYSESLVMYEKEKDKINAQIERLRSGKAPAFDLLDLDRDIAEEKSRNIFTEDSKEDDDLKTDFKYEWEIGYDDFIIKKLENEVIKPMKKDKIFNLIKSYAKDEQEVRELNILYEENERLKEEDNDGEEQVSVLKAAFAKRMDEFQKDAPSKSNERQDVFNKYISDQAAKEYEIFKKVNPEADLSDDYNKRRNDGLRQLEKQENAKVSAKANAEKNKDINNKMRRPKK